jgi:aryl-alcohol dehydrogenase-like predicted oxidoreductase
MELRPLGNTTIRISPVALGCWPIAGMTSAGVNDRDSLATIEACFELGINHLDTAFAYGASGESERRIAKAIAGRRDQLVIATKGGIHWGPDLKQVLDGRPETLHRECEESLRRLNTDRVELYYLHSPDPATPVAESAGAIKQLIEKGKVLTAGLSNANVAQLEEFAAVCPLSAFQPPYNMLQRQIEADTLPWCREHNVAVMNYWPLMKGLLTGKFAREHQFPPGDGRLKYPAFQGAEWQKNHDLLDELRLIAQEAGRSVTQIVINWTIQQPGITSALCGAKRPEQIRDNAGAMDFRLTAAEMARIDAALAHRGTPLVKPAV